MKKYKKVDIETFKKWLETKQIRGASLEDTRGTHHGRPIFAHPNTGEPFVALSGTEASKHK